MDQYGGYRNQGGYGQLQSNPYERQQGYNNNEGYGQESGIGYNAPVQGGRSGYDNGYKNGNGYGRMYYAGCLRDPGANREQETM